MDMLALLHLSLTYRESAEPQIFPGEKQARLASHQLRVLYNLKRQGRRSVILVTESIRPRWRALGERDAVGMQQQLGASSPGTGCQGEKAGGDGQSEHILGQQSQQE